MMLGRGLTKKSLPSPKFEVTPLYTNIITNGVQYKHRTKLAHDKNYDERSQYLLF